MPQNNHAPYEDLYIYYIEGRIAETRLPMDPSFIGNWEEEGFSFLFFTESADPAVSALVENTGALKLLDRFRMSYIDWLGEKVRPFQVGRFLIRPPWELPPEFSGQGEYDIILDPGVVFGTGTHPTTHDCLEAIEQLCYDNKIRTVCDLGTGTGLLAIAACKAGCERVLAVDVNYLAARTAQRNVELNRLTERIIVARGRAETFMSRAADLMISNIHYDVMKDLIGTERFLDNRWFILSGLLRSQAAQVEAQLREQPVSILKTWARDGIWHTFLGKRAD